MKTKQILDLFRFIYTSSVSTHTHHISNFQDRNWMKSLGKCCCKEIEFESSVMLHGKQLETSLWLINYLLVYSGLVNVSYKTDLSFFLQS